MKPHVACANRPGSEQKRLLVLSNLVQWIICNPTHCDEEVLEKISSDLCVFVSYTARLLVECRQPGDLKSGIIVVDALLNRWISDVSSSP